MSALANHGGLAGPMALEGGGAVPRSARPGESLQDHMPQTAGLVDELRDVLGATIVDAILRATVRGGRGFYAAELGADGVLRDWGRAPSGRQAAVQGGQVVLVRRPVGQGGAA